MHHPAPGNFVTARKQMMWIYLDKKLLSYSDIFPPQKGGVDPRISLHSVEKNRVGDAILLGTKTNHSVRNEKQFCRCFSGHILIFIDIVN